MCLLNLRTGAAKIFFKKWINYLCWVTFNDFLLIYFFSKLTFYFSVPLIIIECQMVWFQIRADVFSVLIWVQTFCKCYQRMTKIAASMVTIMCLLNLRTDAARIMKIFGLN